MKTAVVKRCKRTAALRARRTPCEPHRVGQEHARCGLRRTMDARRAPGETAGRPSTRASEYRPEIAEAQPGCLQKNTPCAVRGTGNGLCPRAPRYILSDGNASGEPGKLRIACGCELRGRLSGGEARTAAPPKRFREFQSPLCPKMPTPVCKAKTVRVQRTVLRCAARHAALFWPVNGRWCQCCSRRGRAHR